MGGEICDEAAPRIPRERRFILAAYDASDRDRDYGFSTTLTQLSALSRKVL